MIELYAVTTAEEKEFVAAWAAAAPPGATLHRALRRDVPLRYASLESGPAEGVLLIAPLGDRAAWDAVREAFARRQGFIGAAVLRTPDDDHVAVVHWSSPLMYARAIRAHPDLPVPADAALYAPVRARSRR